jgi:hypothetical protein
MMPVLFLFASMLLLMFMRVRVPLGAKTPGKVVKVTYLTFPERALMQRVNVYSIGLVLLLTTVTGVIAAPVEVLVILIALAILFMPVRCIVTSDGIALNNVVFRPWSDFIGFTTDKRRVTLIGKQGTRPLNIPLLAARQSEVVPLVRRRLPEVKTEKTAVARRNAAIAK